jgi:WD40 repeat protein
MNQVQNMKARLLAYEAKNKAFSAVHPKKSAEDQSEEQQLWNAMQEVEVMREQRYEDLLARNEHLSKLVSEQAQIAIKYSEAKSSLIQVNLILEELMPYVLSKNFATSNNPRESATNTAGNRESVSSKAEGSIFERLANKETFTGMYKVIADDMRERGVGHLGATKIEVKRKKPKREATEALLTEAGVLKGHTSAVYKVSVWESNALTCSMDGTIRIWDLNVMKDMATLFENKAPMRTVAAVPERGMAVSSKSKIRNFKILQINVAGLWHFC